MNGYYEDLYLENLFKSSGYDSQLEAIKALGRMRSKRAVPKLLEIARSTTVNINLKLNSILALSEIGESDFIKYFAPFIDLDDDELTEVLVQAIGKLRATEYVEEFRNFVNYKNKSLKIDMIEALDLVNDERSIKVLIGFYNDIDIEIKEIVRFYLQKSPVFKETIVKMSDEEILNLITVVPEKIAGDVIQKLIHKTENKKIIKILIKAIGELKVKNGTELLEEIFEREEDKEIRLKVIEALENISDSRKKEFLMKIIRNEDRDYKTKALMALGNMSEDESIIELVKEYAEDKSQWWMLRKIAIMIFSKSNSSKRSSVLITILNEEEDIRVARTIISELGELGDSSAIEVISKYLYNGESDIEIQRVALYSLSKLGDTNVLEFLLKNSEARESLFPESLKSMLNFNDERIEKILLDIIEKKKNNTAMIEIALGGLAENYSKEVRTQIRSMIMDKSYCKEIRAKAIMLLAAYPKNESKDIVISVLKDNEEWWLIKKIGLMLCKELRLYETLDIVVDFACDFDIRLKKSAVETAKFFYKELFLDEKNFSNSETYNSAKLFYKLL